MQDMNTERKDDVEEPREIETEPKPKTQRKSLQVQIREKSWFGKKCLKIFKLFTNTFVMTFLAEWGDRSQLATIVMAGGFAGSWNFHQMFLRYQRRGWSLPRRCPRPFHLHRPGRWGGSWMFPCVNFNLSRLWSPDCQEGLCKSCHPCWSSCLHWICHRVSVHRSL